MPICALQLSRMTLVSYCLCSTELLSAFALCFPSAFLIPSSPHFNYLHSLLLFYLLPLSFFLYLSPVNTSTLWHLYLHLLTYILSLGSILLVTYPFSLLCLLSRLLRASCLIIPVPSRQCALMTLKFVHMKRRRGKGR